MDEAQESGQQRPNYLTEIQSLCTTLSGEAMETAEAKAKANQFNVDRGDITFTEVAINLTSAREVLRDAIEKQKLIQLPITVQKELLANLQAVSRALLGLMNNTDEIVNLGNAVEALNTSIWKYGLHNLSGEVLGYTTKLNQLKQQEVRAKNLLAILENGHALSERLTMLALQAENAVEQISKSKLAAQQDASDSATARAQMQEEATKASGAAAAAAQSESQAAQYNAAAKTAESEITPLAASIKGFFGEIDGYRKQISSSVDEVSKFLTESGSTITRATSEGTAKISSEIDRWNAAAKNATESQALALTSSLEGNRTAFAELVSGFNARESERIKIASEADALRMQKASDELSLLATNLEQKVALLESGLKQRSEETIEKNSEETKKHVEELAALKERIKDQLAQATGFGQFGAFQSRQNTVSKGKNFWIWSVGVLAFLVVGLTCFIAYSTASGDLHSAAFWIKLSMNIPLGFLITFCAIQYNRERRLEEEYAFKASISVSLTPYRELIFSILQKDGVLQDGNYTKFVVDSVREIFTSPTERVFESSKGIEGIPEKALKTAAELIGTALKAAK